MCIYDTIGAHRLEPAMRRTAASASKPARIHTYAHITYGDFSLIPVPIAWGTQDTDLKKGFTKEILYDFIIGFDIGFL